MRISRAAAGAVCAAVLSAPATAQAPAAAAAATSGMRVELAYDGRLRVKVLDVRVNASVDGDSYQVSSRMVSSGALALVRRLDQRASAAGAVDDGTARPRSFQHRNGNERSVRVTWSGGDATSVATPAYPDEGAEPVTRAQRVEAADPLTQAVALSLTAQGRDPCARTLRIYDGHRRYDVVMTSRGARAPNAREQRIGLTEPTVCAVRMRPVSGHRPRRPNERRGPERPIQVSLARLGVGGPWVLSSLETRTPLGAAVMELREGRVSYSR